MKPGKITIASYFGAALCLFLLSFVVGWSSKWTNNLFYGLMVLPGLVLLIKQRGSGLFKQPLVWAWTAFILWFLVPATIAGQFQFFKHVFYVWMFVMVIGAFTDPQFFRSPVFVRGQFWILALYIFGCALYSWVSGEYAVGSRVALLPARLQNVIYASIWLLCALALALPIWIRERKLIEGAVAVVFSIFAVVFILQARTALVGVVFLLGVWLLYGLYHKPRLVGSVVALGVVVLGLLVLMVHNEAWYQSLWARGDSYRIEIFNIMVGEWRNCGWMLGCGINFHTSQLIDGWMPIQHPHNIYVALGLYSGAVALALFVVLMASTIWQAWRLRDVWGVYLACALVMLNFDGSLLIGNPDELWPLVLLPAAMILGRALQAQRQALA
ncbi:O-antigen ligase domain-containing protein [Pseudomonas lini]|uniref:membrane protein n=1 Tax=Pseudomonas TaxID=286 RepID=UPI000578F548|nr:MULTISPECIES: membrane protein [Pseudomonas]KNH43324.1 membrane protein [Pseudomonas lini]MDT9675412.1 O-antigen ligase domain-containing protein [Pseudomonas sp. JV414]NSX10366.1 O-antigen ligase domain-containing protein [Pseudomonas lini]